MTTQPTNQDIQDTVEALVHENDINPTNGQIAAMVKEQSAHTAKLTRALFNDDDTPKFVTKEELEVSFDKVFSKYLLTKGGKVKTWLIVSATVVGALMVLFGGVKTVLAWLGFTYIIK